MFSLSGYFLVKPSGYSNFSGTCELLLSLLFDDTGNGILRVLLVLEFAIETDALLLLDFGELALVPFFLFLVNIYIYISLSWKFSC